MPVPTFQALMLPMLAFAGDGTERSMLETRTHLAAALKLSDQDLNEKLPSGTQSKFVNRVAWAKVYLGGAGLIESTKRGNFRITKHGIELLEKNPSAIDVALLEQYPAFKQFRHGKSVSADGAGPPAPLPAQALTPEEQVLAAFDAFRNQRAAELLDRVKKTSPASFESIVKDLLLAMGYGYDRECSGQTVGKSGDEGIDAIIHEDRLGLGVIYVQAKRWEGTIGRPEIQKFVGALHGKQAHKGVFLTTGTYTKDAIHYAAGIAPRVVLVDGPALAAYMIEFGVGVSKKATLVLSAIDGDYFEDV